MMTPTLQGQSQVGEVVKLAVEGDPVGPITVVQRLVTPGQVNDRQACRSQRDARPDVMAGVVRAAMVQRGHHCSQRLFVRLPPGLIRNFPTDAAHVSCYLSA